MDHYNEDPEIIQRFLNYHSTVKGHSNLTTDEYYLDLRTFFRFILIRRQLVPADSDFDKISIKNVDLPLVSSVTLDDVYAYLSFLSRTRKAHNLKDSRSGMQANSRARKVTAIRSFYKYLTLKAHLIEANPVQDLDSPKVLRTLPRYLTLEESQRLLSSVSGKNDVRDFCILMIFLNCGLRISELIGLDVDDIHNDRMTVMGKGGKERTIYLNDSVKASIDAWLNVRSAIPGLYDKALFVSTRKQRVSRSTVNALVKKHLAEAGLDSSKYSSHKLRHTAATLMLHNGVDVRTLQELLGHEHLNTTEIYTHIENEDLRRAAQLSPLADFSSAQQDNLSDELDDSIFNLNEEIPSDLDDD